MEDKKARMDENLPPDSETAMSAENTVNSDEQPMEAVEMPVEDSQDIEMTPQHVDFMTPFLKDNKHRVKLYVLNEQRSWDDKGTGHVACFCDSETNSLSLIVRSENESENVLESRVLLDTAYQKQQETLIVWSESECLDLALSFQEKAGCDEIWTRICSVQGKDPSRDVTQEVSPGGQGDSGLGIDQGNADVGGRFGSVQSSANDIQLPVCELGRLREIESVFSACIQSPIRKESLAIVVENTNYIPGLCELFHMAEDLEDRDGLSLLFKIVKSVLMLNKNSILEILFNETHLKSIVGMLEYDPQFVPRKKHREYLWEKAVFKEVLPIKQRELKAKIHQNYRVQYIQDVILPAPSIFEENMLSSLNSFVFFNRVEIVAMIQEDEHVLRDLFAQLKDKATEEKRRTDLTLFLKEFCTFAQTLQQTGPQGREMFFRTLLSHGVLQAIECCLSSSCTLTRSAAIEIFAMVVDHSPQMARDHLLTQGKNFDIAQKHLLINLLIDQLFCDPDPELSSAMQLMNVLRILIDPDNMMTAPAGKSDKTEFLNFFYKRAMSNLCRPLIDNTAGAVPLHDDYHTAHKLNLVVDILCFCIEHHSYNIRTFCINKDILRRVLVLLRSRHTFLALSSLRLFRRVVQLKDEFYNRHIIRCELFAHVVQCYHVNGHRYNLMNSALLELFEFIRTEDIKSLLLCFVNKYGSQFEDVDYVKTFANLRLRYEQHLDRQTDELHEDDRGDKGSKGVDGPDDGWFNDDDDDDNDDNDNDNDNEDWERKSCGSKTPPLDSASNVSVKSGETPFFRRTDSESPNFFPSVIRKEVDPPSGVFSPVKMHLSHRSQQSIVIKLSSSSSLGNDHVVSSTQPMGAVSAVTSVTGGLVDYDLGDSDSDDEDGKSSEKSSRLAKSDEVVSSTSDSSEPTRKRSKLDGKSDGDPVDSC